MSRTYKDVPMRLAYELLDEDEHTLVIPLEQVSTAIKKMTKRIFEHKSQRRRHGGLRFRKRINDAWEYEERRYSTRTEVPGLRSRETKEALRFEKGAN